MRIVLYPLLFRKYQEELRVDNCHPGVNLDHLIKQNMELNDRIGQTKVAKMKLIAGLVEASKPRTMVTTSVILW